MYHILVFFELIMSSKVNSYHGSAIPGAATLTSHRGRTVPHIYRIHFKSIWATSHKGRQNLQEKVEGD